MQWQYPESHRNPQVRPIPITFVLCFIFLRLSKDNMIWRMMSWKGYGRKLLLSIRGILSPHLVRGAEKTTTNPSQDIKCPAKGVRYLQKTHQQRYQYTALQCTQPQWQASTDRPAYTKLIGIRTVEITNVNCCSCQLTCSLCSTVMHCSPWVAFVAPDVQERTPLFMLPPVTQNCYKELIH
jgi:hypothetical protein